MSTDTAPSTLFDDQALSRSRQPGAGSLASIWAPQPQPSDSTWPKALDSFSRVVESETQLAAHTENQHHPSVPGPVVTREDVFGPSPPKDMVFVGAIGDGRKKVTPDFEPHKHVEQLLRTLDLNSPDPYNLSQKPPLNLSFDTSPGTPDFSPVSISSALLTPTDLSPTRPCSDVGLKDQLHSSYEMMAAGTRGPAFLAHPSLLFEPGSPTRPSNSPPYLSSQASISAAHSCSTNYPLISNASSSPIFKTYNNEQSSPTALSAPTSFDSNLSSGDWHIPQQIIPAHQLLSQSASGVSLNHSQQFQQLSPSGEWLRTDDVSLLAHNSPAHSPSGVYSSTAPTGFGLGLTLDSTPSYAGIVSNSSSGGIEDSIHAPPSLRSSTSSISSAFPSQHHQQSHVHIEGQHHRHQSSTGNTGHPINFLSLLHPSSSPPYHSFVSRIIKSSDQQASIFLQQKLKVADVAERAKIVDAICARGFDMMAHRFGNWAVQRCLEAASTSEERKKIASCMRGRIVELATNCYGCHVLQKALDCEEDIRLLIVSELLLGDPAQTLVNKHASHVWSKIMELTWTPPAPPIFTYVNKSLKGKWAALACHETGSLVVQHAFENLEDSAKDGIIEELLNQGPSVFSEVAKNQWGSYCVQHILEHGSDNHRQLTLDHLIAGLLEYSTNEQGYKSITKALKEDCKETLDRVVKRMCEPAKSSSRRAMVVDLALSVTGSQLIASVLPSADREQRALLYDCIRGHIVTLRGCKTGSKVIWLL
ncbi:pumilio-family RNA binding repeat protein [Lentinula aciculospora]|uniref:Pumilio-family RNA binding repeat protein n=1 Tax=Lentinula aciculospora TaxID=153920 RepID=A0A9W9AA28_9AGAR|nr:pumilio-family RNA binding repeat protein [Lentinula aciculospora]